jgi:hypothetical protein
LETDSPASSGSHMNYVKYVTFPWLPVEAAISIFNVSFFFVKTRSSGKELMKTNDIGINAEP